MSRTDFWHVCARITLLSTFLLVGDEKGLLYIFLLYFYQAVSEENT